MGDLSEGLFDEIRQRLVTFCTQALLAKGKGVPREAEHTLPPKVCFKNKYLLWEKFSVKTDSI